VTATQLFIGVVSYEHTRFPISQGAEGLGHLLTQHINDRYQVQTILHVNATDISTSTVTINRSSVQRSLTAELHAEARYTRYLTRPQHVKNAMRMSARWVRRLQQVFQSPSPRSISRLLNIEASHLDLMRRGLDSDAEYILILEDDAFCDNVSELAQGLVAVIQGAENPTLINLSASFSINELGVDHLLHPDAAHGWQGTEIRTILVSEKPITNTVCAIAYSREFLIPLLAELESLPEEPVLPIDWKLNVALMNQYEAGSMGTGNCWWIEPAPIKQMSMHQ